jgi:hypothetical protein
VSATVIAMIVVGIILTSATTALLTINRTIPTSGTVTPTPTPTTSTVIPPPPTPTPSQGTVEIGVYSDAAFTSEYTSENGITWTAVSPGGSTTQTVYIRNEGSQTVTLQMATSNWSPSNADDYITVTWNREGQTLTAGQSINATLTLSVSSSISGITSYDVNIIITGTET